MVLLRLLLLSAVLLLLFLIGFYLQFDILLRRLEQFEMRIRNLYLQVLGCVLLGETSSFIGRCHVGIRDFTRTYCHVVTKIPMCGKPIWGCWRFLPSYSKDQILRNTPRVLADKSLYTSR